MAGQSTNSLLNSLKGKIWLATSALAFFICSFGIIAYLAVSFLTTETFYAVFIPFLFLSFTVMVFGWWLSNEVVGPIEKVSLLAKSLERSSSTSLPRTTGSNETDELLETLHRSSQQTQNLVTLMDKVANGNLNVALTPLENSDRLSASFQKLLAKVSESINAKQELEELQASVDQITLETAPLKNGDFTVEVTSRSNQTKEIAETFRFLAQTLNDLASQVKRTSANAQNSAVETQKNIKEIIVDTRKRIHNLNHAKLTLKQIPNSVQKIVEELSGSTSNANKSIEKARTGTKNAQANLNTVSTLRKQIQETVKRMGIVNERSQEIGKLAKTVGDLAHRTNMIALNASIQATELDEQGLRYSILEEEVERLAVRAENTNKQISSLDKSITAEINEVENSLQATVGEISKLSKHAIETGDSLGDLERYVGQFLNLQKKLISISNENSTETQKAFQTFVESIADTEEKLKRLEESEKSLLNASDSLENLQFAVMDYKLLEVEEVPVQKPETPKVPLQETETMEPAVKPDEWIEMEPAVKPDESIEDVMEQYEPPGVSLEEIVLAEIPLEQTEVAELELDDFVNAEMVPDKLNGVDTSQPFELNLPS
jgi:methyl-accepting chemotaxis protein